jgi:hypothetical protein
MEKMQGRIAEISEKLYEEFQRVLPLHPEKRKSGKNPSESEIKSRSEAALKKFYHAANEERLRHKLGIISRARVAFSLQQRLLKAGYSVALVKQVLFAMLTSVFIGAKRH